MHRRHFLATATLASLGAPRFVCLRLAAAEASPLSFGLVADPQYADVEPLGTRHYRKSVGKLGEAVAEFNRCELAFCVNLGDLIDRDWRSYDAILAPLAGSRHRFHHVLGNHDFEVTADCKERVPERLGLAQRHYAFAHGGWCFVVLDTNDVSLYAHPESSPRHAEAVQAHRRLSATGARYAQTWNGAVGERQLRWFESVCASASRAGQRVVVFAHHPVHPDGDHNAWDTPRLLEVLERNRNVVMWLNGHNHAGAFAERHGVPFVTLRGMVETPAANAYAVARLWPDRLELTGYGRELSRELPLREDRRGGTPPATSPAGPPS